MRISDWSSDGSSADLADVLIDDHALAIDNEGFRHAGRTQRDLYAAVHVRSDAGIRIAPSGEETIQILPAIPNGDTVDRNARFFQDRELRRSEEHTSELQSLMRISYAVFCLKKKKKTKQIRPRTKNGPAI